MDIIPRGLMRSDGNGDGERVEMAYEQMHFRLMDRETTDGTREKRKWRGGNKRDENGCFIFPGLCWLFPFFFFCMFTSTNINLYPCSVRPEADVPLFHLPSPLPFPPVYSPSSYIPSPLLLSLFTLPLSFSPSVASFPLFFPTLGLCELGLHIDSSTCSFTVFETSQQKLDLKCMLRGGG